MVRSRRLMPIKKLAQNKENEAAQLLGQSLENRKVESQKLLQLQEYRKEYLAQMGEKTASGINGATLQYYHQFLNKLDLAISQQEEVLIRCSEQLDACQEQWKSRQSRTKAVSQVMNKMAVKETKVKEKRESAQLDEMSTQAFLRRQTSRA